MSVQTKTNQISSTSDQSIRQRLLKQYGEIRSFTEKLTEPLEIEDYVVQVVEYASPAKWHLAHTSWFFETFLLEKALDQYQSVHPQYGYLFNSYYLQTGEPHCRDKRGYISRPTVNDVYDYRRTIDEEMFRFIREAEENLFEEWKDVIEIGLHHEQQHQELLLTDLKYMFSQNPLFPAYKDFEIPVVDDKVALEWTKVDEQIGEIGHNGGRFGYDNEFPRHKTYIHEFEIANRLVTNGEYLEFMDDGGYENSRWWLDEGYATVLDKGWECPLYWVKKNGRWHQFTLSGLHELRMNEPVSHVSYYEADAYARWAGYRLPTEQEWETVAAKRAAEGHFAEGNIFHPIPAVPSAKGIQQLFGNLWEWTQSAYSPYPGYEPLPGALGEYNGKFMCNQYVLRGGSCATSKTHIRSTYRNFFHPDARWQFMGIRLAK